MRILLTGASGCIGHYITEALLQETDCELVLVVRNPDKLNLDGLESPRVQIVTADLRDPKALAPLLPAIDTAILTATAWGGPEEIMAVNVGKTLQLMQMLDRERCQQIIYFSTASILNYEHELLPEAGSLGTDYIRSKYECYRQLEQLDKQLPPLTVLFPTLVLGGDDRKPKSHLSAGLPEVAKWASLARWFRTEGSFHFAHARDIAQIVRYLVQTPSPDRREFVMGNSALSADAFIAEVCSYLGLSIYARLSLTPWLTDGIIKLFRIQMADWDRFCLQQRHLVHRQPVTPAHFGLVPYCPTLTVALRLAGIPEFRRSLAALQ